VSRSPKRAPSPPPKKTAAAWAQFTATIAQLCAPEVRAKTDAMIRLVLEAGYEDYLKATYPNFRNRLEDLEQLAAFSRQFPTVEDFLTQLALLTNVEPSDLQHTNCRRLWRASIITSLRGWTTWINPPRCPCARRPPPATAPPPVRPDVVAGRPRCSCLACSLADCSGPPGV
jgi:hypothetical protein